jgi:zinc transporter
MTGFAYHIAPDGKTTGCPIDEALGAADGLVWVHLSTNNDEAQAWLSEQAKLDDYLVDALTANETRPRCEQVGDGALLNLRGRAAEREDGVDQLVSVRVWAVAGRVFSVTRRTMPAVEQVKREVADGKVNDPGDLITAFATAITEDLDPDVADLGDTLDSCESDLDAERVFELRRAVTRVRVQAIGYRRFLTPQRAAVEKLAALPVPWLRDDDRLHLSAAADRAARMAEELESIRERSALTHEALTDLRAEQIDQRALIISVIAMIFLPLTFITGLLGMNVKGIWFADEPWAFDAVCLLCLLLALGVGGYFVQRHWLR